MKKKEIAKVLTDKDRTVILSFFNMIFDFKKPKEEYNIDDHLKKNLILFLQFCDYFAEHYDDFMDLKSRLDYKEF